MRRLGVALLVVLSLAGCTASPTPEPPVDEAPVMTVPGPELPFAGDCSSVLSPATASEAAGVTLELSDLGQLFRHAVSPEALAPEAAGGLLCDWASEGETAGWVTVLVLPADSFDARSRSFRCSTALEGDGGTQSCGFATVTSGLWFSVVLGGASGFAEADFREGAKVLEAEFTATAATLDSVPVPPAAVEARTCGSFGDIAASVESPSLEVVPSKEIANAPLGYHDALVASGYVSCSWEPSGDETAEGELDGFLFSYLPDAPWAESRIVALGATQLRLEGVDSAWLLSSDGIDTVHAFVGDGWVSVENYGDDIVAVLPAVQALAAALG
jgi:hypothetical protein